MAQAQRFIVLYAIDVEDLQIGTSCLMDYSKMDTTFQEIATNIHFHYEPIVLMRGELNKRSLENKIDNLQVGSNDVLVFYYAGHGFAELNQKSPYPALYLKGEETATLDAIYVRLKKKKARLLLTFADCCNNIIVKFNGLPTVKPLVERTINVENDILRKLFKESKGSIILSSARRNETAAGYTKTGGFYTCFWKESLLYAQAHNTHITWETLLTDAETRLQRYLKSIKGLDHTQHSQWDIAEENADTSTTHEVEPIPKIEPIPADKKEQSPVVTFSVMNRFLNTLADESLSYNERVHLLETEMPHFFAEKAGVKVYVRQIDNKVSAIPIADYLDQIVLVASLIKQINVVENRSTFDKEGRYQQIILQEIR